jgi:xanthine dehydrogenase accessory factor
MVTVPMACESDGAVEVFLEPVLPRPQVVVIGRSPAVSTLADLAVAIGWDAAVVDDGGDAAGYAHPELVRTTLDLDGLGIGNASAVVVATQGHYDDLALEAALATDAGYVGLVSSAKRAASTIELLRGRGLADEQLCRIVAPAGLDLGAIENAEIAVAVLADLVARRAAGGFGAVAPPLDSPALEVDPICGMAVDPATAKYRAVRDGVGYFFCSPGCKAAFEAA